MFVRAVCKIQIRKVSSGPDAQSINCSSYWVLVPITHLRGLFSCQLPCRNSQLHDFWKRVWAQQVLTDSPNSHSDSVCQQNTRDLQSRWRQWQKKTKTKQKLNWITVEMIRTFWMLRNISAMIMESRQLGPVFAAVEHACVTHALHSIGAAKFSVKTQTGHIVMSLRRQCREPPSFFFLQDLLFSISILKMLLHLCSITVA